MPRESRGLLISMRGNVISCGARLISQYDGISVRFRGRRRDYTNLGFQLESHCV